MKFCYVALIADMHPIDPNRVTNALKQTNKGKLEYDRHWNQEIKPRLFTRKDSNKHHAWCGTPGPGRTGIPCARYTSTPQNSAQQQFFISPNMASPISSQPHGYYSISLNAPTNMHCDMVPVLMSTASPVGVTRRCDTLSNMRMPSRVDSSMYVTAMQTPPSFPEPFGRHPRSDGNTSEEDSDDDDDDDGDEEEEENHSGSPPRSPSSPASLLQDSGTGKEKRQLTTQSDISNNEPFCQSFEDEKKMHEYNERLARSVTKTVMIRGNLAEENVKLLHFENLRQSSLAAEKKQQAARQIQETLRMEQEEGKKESLKRQESAKERHKQHTRTVLIRAQLLEQKEREAQQRKEEQQRLSNKMTDEIREYQSSLSVIMTRIIELLRKPGVSSKGAYYSTKVRQCTEGMNDIIKLFSSRMPIEDDVRKAAAWVEQANDVEKQLIQLQESEEERIKEEEKAKQAQITISSELSKEVVANCVYKSSLTRYAHLIDKMKEAQEKIDQFKADTSLKSFKFQLQKAVNLPLNTVTDVTVSHLKEKVTKLTSLLAGNSVSVSKDKPVSANQHPLGGLFVTNLLALKIVKKAEAEISSKADAAYPLAAVVVSIWSKFPEFGELFLAHLYTACPFLVPYYIPQVEGQGEEDYYRSLGYVYGEDGSIEKQDAYLRRMSGLVRLYAAVVQTRPIGGNHPHYINNAWVWLAQVLNLTPRPDVTATVLFEFLTVCGWLLGSSYGTQFKKLLHILCAEFFPKMKAATPDDMMGPVTRLEGFLETVVKEGRIQPPNGKLGPAFDNIA